MEQNQLSYPEYISYNKQSISSLVKDFKKSISLKSTIKYLLEFEKNITKVVTRFINTKSHLIPDNIQYTLQEIGNFYQVDTSYIFLFAPDKTNFSMVFEWVKLQDKSIKYLAQNLSESVFPWDLQLIFNQKIIYIPPVNVSDNFNQQLSQHHLAFNFKSLICLPLIFNYNVIGWLTLASDSETKIWKKNEIKGLKIFTEILAHALQIQDEELTFSIEKDR